MPRVLCCVGLPNFGCTDDGRQRDRREAKERDTIFADKHTIYSWVPVYMHTRFLSFTKMCLSWGPKQKTTIIIIKCKYRNLAATSVGHERSNESKQLFRSCHWSQSSAEQFSAIPFRVKLPQYWTQLKKDEKALSRFMSICDPNKIFLHPPRTASRRTGGQTLVGQCEIGESNTESDFWNTRG